MFSFIIRFGISNKTNSELNEISLTTINFTLNNLTDLPDYVYLNLKNENEQKFVYSYKKPKENDGQKVNYFEEKASFNPEIFFNILLPPIIFSAGYSMKRVQKNIYYKKSFLFVLLKTCYQILYLYLI